MSGTWALVTLVIELSHVPTKSPLVLLSSFGNSWVTGFLYFVSYSLCLFKNLECSILYEQRNVRTGSPDGPLT